MFDYLKGYVTEINKDSVTLELNDTGYKINTPNPYAYTLDEYIKVYTYLYIRDEVLYLYGFRTRDERELFLQLISVSGIGPKSATAIIATGSVSQIAQAINNGDAKFLCKFPGIGTKSAQQIVLDLKGKIKIENYKAQGNYLVLDEVHEALLALGYSEKDINKVLPMLDTTRSVNDLIKDALKKIVG